MVGKVMHEKSEVKLTTGFLEVSKRKPLQVLHVDDEEGFLNVAKECLQMQGAFEVDTALSVDEAFKKLEKKAYDAIVCDYQMSGRDGLKFLEELRKSGDCTPFILFTGKGREEVAVKALNLGANGYISKHGDPDTVYCELAHAIRQAVEKTRAEKLLKMSEAKYRTFFENAYEGVLLLDLKGNITDVNNAVLEYGFRKEDLLGRNITEFVSLKGKLQLLKEIAKKLKGKSVENVIEVNTPKGKVLVAYRSKPLIIEGRVVGIQAILTDITEKEDIRNSEEKYRRLFDEALDAIFIADAETGLIVDCNSAATELVDREKSELIGKHHSILHPKERIREGFSITFKQHLEGREDILEDQVVTKNGEIKDVAIKAKVFEFKGKKLIQGIFRDITKQKRAEKALRESEEAYRTLLNGMNDTAWVIGFDGKFIDVNDAAVRVLGYSREELLRMGPQDIDSSLTEEQIKELIRNMPKDKIQVFETTHVTKDGRVIPVEISSSLVTYKGIKAILSIARDISERKKAEEKLNKAMEELRRVNEKLGVVGKWTRHDARNKLSVIKSNVYLAKKKLTSQHTALKYLNEIELACDQIVKIFDFASAYEMLGLEERSYVDVGKSFDEAVSLSLGLGHVEVVNECHGLMVLADSQLRQLFYNLVDNSLKHGEKVSRIKIYYKKDETEKDKLKLIYEDNGIGISSDTRPNLFKEGYGKGTGYGLYLTAKLCEIYGWKIQETGEYGKGAQFTMSIPKTNEKGQVLYKLQK